MRRYFTLLIFATAVWVSGCSTLQKAPDTASQPDSPEVAAILQQIGQTNSELLTFKGSGKIKLWKKHDVHVLHAIWVGFRPDKIRIVIEAVSGFPTVGMAADGNWFYLLSYGQNTYYKAEVKDPNLEKLVSVSITAGDIIQLISGGIPIRPYQSSTLLPSSDSCLLSLRKGRVDIEKIYLDVKRTRVQRIEMFTDSGDLAYRVDRAGENEYDGFRIPASLTFETANDSGFQLDTESFWPNVPAPPQLFVITPEG